MSLNADFSGKYANLGKMNGFDNSKSILFIPLFADMSLGLL